MKDIYEKIAQSLSIRFGQVERTIELMNQGATIPFISRYRKEATGELDEVQIENVKTLYDKFTDLEKRRQFILESISTQGKMDDKLSVLLHQTQSMEQLEDIYLPYKPKRRTRAAIAIEKGLEPLAKIIISCDDREIERAAIRFVTDEVENENSAIVLAMDIVAEWISENSSVRSMVRESFHRDAIVSSVAAKGKASEESKYRNYYDFSEPLRRVAPNRLLALLRGEREGELKLKIDIENDKMIERIDRFYQKNVPANRYKSLAVADSFKRLISPSIETEIRAFYKAQADEKAIKIFSSNLKQLLLAAPLGEKRVLAIDPGFRTGCKIVVLANNGDLLHTETIYPHEPKNEWAMAQKKLSTMVEAYKVDAIAIGDGTASRQSEALVKSIHFNRAVEVYVVSEDGASIYSASAAAREEFPDYDVTVRGSVSIGRRLIDPLAELVKIDPKSLGIGEYQHDVDQGDLKRTLDFVVESCVNSVGVNLNTASYHILTYISGIGATLSKNIVKYRSEKGEFRSRRDILKVPRLGEKVFEQAAGFLRITNGSEPLDASAVHPESYYVVRKIASDLGVSNSELIGNKKLLDSVDIAKYVDDRVGLITLKDIIKELAKPALDPRQKAMVLEFASDVNTLADLAVGRVLNGIVTNITSFGAFVDIGIKQDGLVHISQMSKSFISSPTEAVALHQHITVKVLEIDQKRGRVSLSMIDI